MQGHTICENTPFSGLPTVIDKRFAGFNQAHRAAFFFWVLIEANNSYDVTDGYAGENAQGPEPHKGDLVPHL